MLYYAEVAMGHGEVPHMRCLCIHISGCRQRCRHCQSPALQQPDFGDPLLPALADILQLYAGRCDCVCFLGEGSAGETERREFAAAAAAVTAAGLGCCLYSGRDLAAPEAWMRAFDYVKLGSYKAHLGPLTCPATNQRLYRRTPQGWQDITCDFW